MKVSIFVVSFKRDLPFMGYLCRSFEKFCSGFHEFVVAVPYEDRDAFVELAARFKFVRLVDYHDHNEKKFLMHQVQKLKADEYCTGDFITHVDSDCMFWQPCTPDFYFVDGRPVLYREKFATVVNKMRVYWQVAVYRASGIDCEHDYMVRHPAIHPRELYDHVRLSIQRHTGKHFADYVLSCKNEFPQSFAEHPLQGAVAQQVMPERYSFVDFDVLTPDGGYEYTKERDALKAFWSHGGIDRYREEADKIIA